MSDSDDSFVGGVLALFVAVALFAAASGNPLQTSRPSSPASAATPSTRPAPTLGSRSTNIPGGVLRACRGEVISNETVNRNGSSVNLKVYYQSDNGGRNCAVATKIGSAARRSGPVVINLRFAASESRDWPQYAEHRSSAAAARSGAVYLDSTDDRCVRAEARFDPADGKAVTVASGTTGCD